MGAQQQPLDANVSSLYGTTERNLLSLSVAQTPPGRTAVAAGGRRAVAHARGPWQ